MKLLYKLFPEVFKWNRKAYCLYYHKNGKNIYNAFSVKRNKKFIDEYLEDDKSIYNKVLRVSENGYKWLTDFIFFLKVTDIIDKSNLKMQMRPNIVNAFLNYQVGDYLTALKDFNKLVYDYNDLYEYLFYYMRRCEHVLSIPLIEGFKTGPLMPKENKTKYNRGAFLEVFHSEIHFSLDLIKWKYKPKNYPIYNYPIRCKWCGRFIFYIDPNQTLNNYCIQCKRMYPAPSFLWDSPDGRAYSYFKGSFKEDDFYEEFEEDYEVQPKREKKDIF